MLFKIYGEVLYGPRHTKEEMKNAIENVAVAVNDLVESIYILNYLPCDVKYEVLENKPKIIRKLVQCCPSYAKKEEIAEYINQILFDDKRFIQSNITDIEKLVLNILIMEYGYKKVHIKEVI